MTTTKAKAIRYFCSLLLQQTTTCRLDANEGTTEKRTVKKMDCHEKGAKYKETVRVTALDG